MSKKYYSCVVADFEHKRLKEYLTTAENYCQAYGQFEKSLKDKFNPHIIHEVSYEYMKDNGGLGVVSTCGF